MLQTNINGEQKKEIGILSRRMASAKQDFEEQVYQCGQNALPFRSSDKKNQLINQIQFAGEPVPAAFGAEGQQSDQIGGTGEQIIYTLSTFGG